MKDSHLPQRQGLYDPRYEHDSCGVGFVCNINGQRSPAIIEQGLTVLEYMSHRGAVGADPQTGDGAGILIQIPHDFYAGVCSEQGINLPAEGSYGTGLIFLPTAVKERKFCQEVLARIVAEEGQLLLGWRDVPVNEAPIGKLARETQPLVRQIFIGQGEQIENQLTLERKLYVIRKRAEQEIAGSAIQQKSFFYITNLSSRTVSYKGLLKPEQVRHYYPELNDGNLASALALVHSRYSTNTFPTWDLAQPFRFLAHNGEINTLRGNINWMRARERLLATELFGNDIAKIKPVIVEGKSDSAIIDNVFELLVLSGRSLPHVMMMLIPGAWEHDRLLSGEIREFYQYHACLLEPWDGPAAIAFTDGKDIGAVLDRNGLRPARYLVTKNGFCVMASEVGVLNLPPEEIQASGRLEPGRMFYIDTVQGRIIADNEIKHTLAAAQPYELWNKENIVCLDNVLASGLPAKKTAELLPLWQMFGYSREDLKLIVQPMAEQGQEPIGSMGNDTPHACLSRQPQTLYSYFKQLFAQVTNPAIDPIREKLVMSLETFIGPEKNILAAAPEHAHRLKVTAPVLSSEELDKIRDLSAYGFKTKTVFIYFNGKEEADFARALERVCFETEYAIEEGYDFVILSDRGVDKDHIALPALLAVSAVHQHLVKKTIRSELGIVLESGEPREVHHFALLFGYGADCVCPYLAYETIGDLCREKKVSLPAATAQANYRQAVHKGILKVLSKMGISTLRSYRGAQIFEALGLADDFIEKYFTGTTSRIGGSGLAEVAAETVSRHREAFPERTQRFPYLTPGGVYQWKRDGEFHLWNPDTIAALQDAVRKEDYSRYRDFAGLINDQTGHPTTLRSLLEFRRTMAVPLEEVEPASDILKRFVTGAMSFGSISKNTHESLAVAMNRLGGKSNTGEGGEDPARFVVLPNGDSARSAIKQIASGRFGVTTNYLINADELQIKIAQGAKPGEGGQLPGHKVSAIIARTRYTTSGVTLISPPPHHDIYSIEDLAQLIFDLKNVNPKARISVKLVSEVGVGTIAAGVAKGHADMILISGGDGGTGASPRSSIRHAGLPWELGLSETHQTLVLNDLRSRVRLQTDGQLRTGRDVAIAALLGAEEYGFCTAALITLGCVMLRHCHLNNCSVGVATQDPLLERRFRGRPEYVANYLRFVAQDLREVMAQLGMRKIEEMIGRTDLLAVSNDLQVEKAKKIDFSRILYQPPAAEGVGIYCQQKQDHGIATVKDRELIAVTRKAVREGKSRKLILPISNTDRTTGAMLSGEICRVQGEKGLPEDTIQCKFTGVAGQSFGAFLVKGVTFELEGLANDYVGKGIFGGKIIIYPDKKTTYSARENIIIGNTAFYGAIAGEAYIRGVAGERFCIRNSGLYAVIEGVGDHGCEYMTGGRVVILGACGRNFAAGMSGGIAYIYNKTGDFQQKCNQDMVLLEELNEEDHMTVYNLIYNHHKYTDSQVADKIIANLDEEIKYFIKVMPVEYKRILAQKDLEAQLGIS